MKTLAYRFVTNSSTVITTVYIKSERFKTLKDWLENSDVITTIFDRILSEVFPKLRNHFSSTKAGRKATLGIGGFVEENKESMFPVAMLDIYNYDEGWQKTEALFKEAVTKFLKENYPEFEVDYAVENF